MNDYTDIITLPHHISGKHRRMTMPGRAAQFAPFAALTGFDEDIDETARRTDSRPAQTEDQLCALNNAMLRLAEQSDQHPLIAVTWFRPDARKDGGTCRTVSGHFRFLDLSEMRLKFTEGNFVPVPDILQIVFLTEQKAETQKGTV